MVGRNQKGQILIESIFLMFMFVSLMFILQNIIVKHQEGMKKIRLSKEISKGYKNENKNSKN